MTQYIDWKCVLSPPDFSEEFVEWKRRINRLVEERGMTRRAAETVVSAAMYGFGCLEGTVRKKIQEEIDAKN